MSLNSYLYLIIIINFNVEKMKISITINVIKDDEITSILHIALTIVF